MKVLAVNKFYYPKGGSETYYFSLNSLLEQNGQKVIPFSMKDKKNIASQYEEYFIDHVDYHRTGKWDKLKCSAKIIYSFEARNKISRIIEKTKPDLAHLHIFQHQLSPSILKEIKNHNIPVVNTVHDLKVLCPNYKMLNHAVVCEKCRGHKYYNCALNRCVKSSLAGSLVNTAEMYLHWLLGSYNSVDLYITPSRFYRDKMLEYGYSESKVAYIPNFVDASLYTPNYASGNYFLFFGRLSEEKGVLTLVEAMKNVRGIDLYIAGEGPLKGSINELIRKNRLKNVKCVGFRTGNELRDLIVNSKFTVLPSEYYENSPLSVFESMAYGKPVIGADIGGIPELVRKDRTGLLFAPGNAEELAGCINRLAEQPGRVRQMGKEAREIVESEYDKNTHYEKISRAYNTLLKKGEVLWKA